MKKLTMSIAAIAALAFAAPAAAIEIKVNDPTPTGSFSDKHGGAGYVEVDTDERVIRACNENPNTPAGDSMTGYIWVSQNGESTTPTYGNKHVGAGDFDGEGKDDGNPDNGTEENDCP